VDENTLQFSWLSSIAYRTNKTEKKLVLETRLSVSRRRETTLASWSEFWILVLVMSGLVFDVVLDKLKVLEENLPIAVGYLLF